MFYYFKLSTLILILCYYNIEY